MHRQLFRMRLTENQAVPALGHRLCIGPVLPRFSSHILWLKIYGQMMTGLHLLQLRQILQEVYIFIRFVRRRKFKRITATLS